MITDTTSPEPTEAELDAYFTNYDPVFDAPSPVQVSGNVKLPEPSLQGLPPEMRQEIEAKLANVTPGNRDVYEREFIRDALVANSRKVRLMAGFGEGATATQRADAEIANEVRLLDTEAKRIEALLDEYRMVEDPVTKELVSTPHKRIEGDQRSGYQHRLAEIRHHVGRLLGPEGEKRKADALAKDKANHRNVREQIAEFREAEQLAATMERDARIKRMAEAKARFGRSNLG